MSLYTVEHLAAIKENPHIISWILGKDNHSQVHSEWIRFIWGTGKSVSLNAHRGSYKSTAIALIGSIWYMLFHPEVRICLVRKTYEDAAKGVNAIAQMMESPEIRELFRFAHGEYPEFRMRREGRIDFTFRKSKTPEGSVTGLGLNGNFVGKHFDFILADDISTIKDKLSRAEREFTKVMWRELITNIVDPGKPCCYIGTPWHPDGVESLITPRKYSINDVSILTPEQIAEKKANCTPSEWAANYLLEFAPAENAPFREPLWGDWLTRDIESPVAHLDAAYGGADACALTIMARRASQEIQAVGFLFPGSIKDWAPTVWEKMKLYRAKKLYCEKQSDRGYTAMLMKAQGASVHEYDENMNKQHKIQTYGSEIWDRLIWSKDTDDRYMTQITDWTYDSKDHDDAPDSMSCLSKLRYSKLGAKSERWKI